MQRILQLGEKQLRHSAHITVAHFHVCGYVNKQIYRCWTSNNPHELRQRPSVTVTVWCEVYSHGIIGPYFFENEEGFTVTVHAERYKVVLETFLRIECNPPQRDLL